MLSASIRLSYSVSICIKTMTNNPFFSSIEKERDGPLELVLIDFSKLFELINIFLSSLTDESTMQSLR